MSVVPKSIPDKINWYALRQAAWTTNSTAIGISSAEMTAMSAKITTAQNALDAHDAAMTASKDATVALYEAANLMGIYGADLIKKIRAKAGQVGGDSVYVLASVPPPATPAPTAPPGKPTDLVVELDETGVLGLKWKCPNPAGTSGTLYQVFRRTSPTAEFTYLGGTGVKEFTDETLPAGSSQVTYQIQAVRSTAVGPWAQFNVNFGVGGGSGGAMIASVTEGVPTKIAA